ncbi:branched-chain amino acid ABC transporter permease [Mesorhizobium sp. Root157]|uniref:branched-chain amino acid ABC transporter permease n=1 Tax=Mesorhizobium sp. Root157 TaxID=1736477 RepID=UPI0006F67E40|nr:branched-chain amino acid ABC transporter permease [Mesorhizobium sp. Root157]KQZ93937.1 branched-chain amino acid ABC transporter permease [Mesorhizobium sp. Root157]
MLYLLQQVLNGLHSGALYALLAFGYALTNGVLHRTNLAYGGLFAFSGQTMILVSVFGWNVLWLTLPATVALGIAVAIAYTALVSTILASGVFQPLANASPNAIVTATLGVLLALTEFSRIAADTHDFWLPPMLAIPVVFARSGGFEVTMTVIQLANCLIAAAALGFGGLVLARSGLGRTWRAVCDDPHAAALCGIDTRTVFRRSVVAGGLYAALAGVMAGLYYGNIGFGAGLIYGLKILFVTAVGGYLSPFRAALGAAAFGLGESLWAGYFPTEWRDAWMLALLAAMLVLVGAGRDTVKAA